MRKIEKLERDTVTKQATLEQVMLKTGLFISVIEIFVIMLHAVPIIL